MEWSGVEWRGVKMTIFPHRGRVDDVELSVRHRRADQVVGLGQLVLVIHNPVLLDDVGGLDAPGVAASRKGTREGWGHNITHAADIDHFV